MIKSSDNVLNLLHIIASTDNILSDMPACAALLHSMVFWRNYDICKNDTKFYFFIQLLLNPRLFSKSDMKIADELHICQKSVQNYRKEFKNLFKRDYETFQLLDRKTLLTIIRSELSILEAKILNRPQEDDEILLNSRALQFFRRKISIFHEELDKI